MGIEVMFQCVKSCQQISITDSLMTKVRPIAFREILSTEVIEVLVSFVVTVIPTSEVVEILSADLVQEQSLICKLFITHSIIFNLKSFYF
jgi:hypothetical protein